MKKVISKLIPLILSICLLIGCCTACNWITTDTDRDMAQVVATIQVGEAVNAENILKKELNAGYMSYGYQYVSQYGYTTSAAYKAVLDNLVGNEIVIQQSRIELAKLYNDNLTKDNSTLTDFEKYFKTNALANGESINPASSDIDSLKQYLTQYEYDSVIYQTKKNINDLIDSYEKESTSSSSSLLESVSYSLRTAPSSSSSSDLTEYEMRSAVPTDNEYKIADVILKKGETSIKNNYNYVYDLNNAVFNNFEIDITSSTSRKKAFSKVIKFLKDNGLIASNESYNYSDVMKYSYFSDMVKTLAESAIVNKYEYSLISSVEAKLTNNGVWEQYVKEYENQKALYQNDISSYESALSSATEESPILYNPFSGYGYVWNLLIGFDSEQTTALSDETAKPNKTVNDIKTFRNNLANNLIAKDQRDSWVKSSFGTYDKTDKSFTFDKDYRVSSFDKLDKYLGEVITKNEDGISDTNENGVVETKWSFSNVIANEMSFNNFFNDFVTVGTNSQLTLDGHIFDENDSSTVATIADYNNEMLNVIKDITFAFGTDPGVLGTEYGYLYSPNSSTYVKEFEAAAKAVTEKGVGSYTIVLTDYGYHLIISTKLVESNYNINTDEAKFKDDLSVKGTAAYNFRKSKLSKVTDNEISKISNKIVNEYKETKVTYFEKTYSDLIQSSSSSTK